MLKIRKKTKGIAVLQIFLIVLLVINLSVIWASSAKDSKKSSKTSNSIAEPLAKKTVKNFSKLPKEKQKKEVQKINVKIRTFGHFAEFVPLGMLFLLLMSVMFDFRGKSFKELYLFCISVSLALCLLTAAADEVHQLFVKGRTFQFTDILVDMLGSFCGCIFSFVVLRIFRHKLIY